MARVRVNNEFDIEGKITVERMLRDEGNYERLIIEGALLTDQYIEEIFSLETDRFKIDGVKVFHESFGSESDEILYTFNASDFILKG